VIAGSLIQFFTNMMLSSLIDSILKAYYYPQPNTRSQKTEARRQIFRLQIVLLNTP